MTLVDRRKTRAPLSCVASLGGRAGALLLAFAVLALPPRVNADCPDKPDPAVSCESVITPCSINGQNQLLPGAPTAAKGACSGNALFPFSVGALQLFFNSQMSPLSPDVREDEGFGKGITAFYRLTIGDSAVWLRSPSGGVVQFVPAGPDQWHSAYRSLGDLVVIKKQGGAYKVLSSDGSTILLSANIRGHFYATEWVQSSGVKTLTVSYRGTLPTRVTSSDGSYLVLSSSDGTRVDRVRDADGVEYRLAYDDAGYLVGYLDPANGQTLIFYTLANSDKERYPTQMSNRFGQTITYAYYKGGVIRAISDSSSGGTRFTGFSYSPTKIVAEYETPSGPRQHSTTVFTRIGQEPFISERYRGDKSPDQNPGVLLSKVTRNAAGQVRRVQAPFGQEVAYFYGTSPECNEIQPQVSPVATCVRSNDGSEVRVRVAGPELFYSPLEVTTVSPSGQVVSTKTFSWLGLGALASVQTKRGDTVVSSASITYENGFPKTVTTTGEQTFSFDDSVVKDRTASIVTTSGDMMSYQYDGLGRVVRSEVNGSPTQYSFENLGNGIKRTTVSSFGITRQSTSDFWGENVAVSVRSSLSSDPAPAQIALEGREAVGEQGTRSKSAGTVVMTRNGGSLSIGGEASTQLGTESLKHASVSKFDVN